MSDLHGPLDAIRKTHDGLQTKWQLNGCYRIAIDWLRQQLDELLRPVSSGGEGLMPLREQGWPCGAVGARHFFAVYKELEPG